MLKSFHLFSPGKKASFSPLSALVNLFLHYLSVVGLLSVFTTYIMNMVASSFSNQGQNMYGDVHKPLRICEGN